MKTDQANVDRPRTPTLTKLHPPDAEAWQIDDTKPTIEIVNAARGGTYQFHLRRDRRSSITDVAAPLQSDVSPVDDVATPDASNINVSTDQGEVVLKLGEVTLRCTPSTATWLSKALTEAATEAATAAASSKKP